MRKFSKIGTLFYNYCHKAGLWLYDHPVFYYILLFTWGLPVSIVGLIVSLIMLITIHRPRKYYRVWYFTTLMSSWGGMDLGCMFVIGKYCNSVRPHEFGHSFQTALFGPFFWLFIGIPSALRYWYLTIKSAIYKKKGKTFTYDYDAVWFEASATDIGKTIVYSNQK